MRKPRTTMEKIMAVISGAVALAAVATVLKLSYLVWFVL